VDPLLSKDREISNCRSVCVLASKLLSLSLVFFSIWPSWESAFLVIISLLIDSGTWQKVMFREVRLNFIISVSKTVSQVSLSSAVPQAASVV
jgi:hypothetical protein